MGANCLYIPTLGSINPLTSPRFFDLFVAMCNHVDDIVEIGYVHDLPPQFYHSRTHVKTTSNNKSPKTI